MSGYFQVMTTTDRASRADHLAKVFVEQRVAACVQVIGPIRSHYRWQGRVEEAGEWLLLIKTTGDRLDALMDTITANHSYDVPEITVTEIVGGSEPYLNWLTDGVTPNSG